MPAEQLRGYCGEADIFLELFTSRCRERGLSIIFGGNPNVSPPPVTTTDNGDPATARIFLETASTHTGTNVEFSLATLAAIGLGATPEVAVVQQPVLHRRTCLTWEKQLGKRPVGWTLAPREDVVGRSTAELLKYALGEMRRIPAYSAEDKAFCVMPPDFPHDGVASLEALEPAFLAALDLEAKRQRSE